MSFFEIATGRPSKLRGREAGGPKQAIRPTPRRSQSPLRRQPRSTKSFYEQATGKPYAKPKPLKAPDHEARLKEAIRRTEKERAKRDKATWQRIMDLSGKRPQRR